MSSHLFAIAMAWIIIALGVAFHASIRDRSALVWGLVTVFTGIFGLAVYGIVLVTAGESETAEEVRTCSNCSATYTGSPKYCSDCGEPLDADDDVATATTLRSGSDGYCSNCKSQVSLDADTCGDCGAVL